MRARGKHARVDERAQTAKRGAGALTAFALVLSFCPLAALADDDPEIEGAVKGIRFENVDDSIADPAQVQSQQKTEADVAVEGETGAEADPAVHEEDMGRPVEPHSQTTDPVDPAMNEDPITPSDPSAQPEAPVHPLIPAEPLTQEEAVEQVRNAISTLINEDPSAWDVPAYVLQNGVGEENAQLAEAIGAWLQSRLAKLGVIPVGFTIDIRNMAVEAPTEADQGRFDCVLCLEEKGDDHAQTALAEIPLSGTIPSLSMAAIAGNGHKIADEDMPVEDINGFARDDRTSGRHPLAQGGSPDGADTAETEKGSMDANASLGANSPGQLAGEKATSASDTAIGRGAAFAATSDPMGLVAAATSALASISCVTAFASLRRMRRLDDDA